MEVGVGRNRHTAYKHDVLAIIEQAIKNIEAEIIGLKRRCNQAKRRLEKAKHIVDDVQGTEKYRQAYYTACLEVGTWERRLAIATRQRNKALSDLNYYKVGGSC